jgi:hypothetical protein
MWGTIDIQKNKETAQLTSFAVDDEEWQFNGSPANCDIAMPRDDSAAPEREKL